MKAHNPNIPNTGPGLDQSSDVADTQMVESPRIVIRGESTHPPLPPRTLPLRNSKSIVDYLGFTFFSEEPLTETFPLKSVLVDVFNMPPSDWKRTKAGWQGYNNRVNFGSYGLVAFGGISQRQSVHVELYGAGCALVNDWVLVHDWFVTTDSRITRVDLAHDDLEGTVVNIANALEWFDDGLFSTNGRPPNRHMEFDFNSGKGKTFYIGERGNDKYTRVYEKGKQLGDPNSNWCRAEVEFKARSKTIPNEVFLYPDDYLSGSFPAFEYLSNEQSKFESKEKARQISLSKTTQQAKSAYGKLVNLLCLIHENDYEKVINMIRRSGIPKSLEPIYKDEFDEQRASS
ncbi:MAG: phage replication initiation protein [Oleiphilaceae bacterium]|jgi:phage replication initiation protein